MPARDHACAEDGQSRQEPRAVTRQKYLHVRPPPSS
jgi:hypothetical protein